MLIMSYNIHSALDDNLSHPWKNRRRLVKDLVSAVNCDLIGFQEPTCEQFLDLADLLSNYSHLSHDFSGITKNDEIETNPIFYKKDRFKVVENGYFYLSPTPGRLSKGWGAKFFRGTTWACFFDKMTGKYFYFFNTHFDYHSRHARNQSALLLRSKIKEIATTAPFIITGDFNLFPKMGEKYTYKLLTARKGQNKLWDAKERAIFSPKGPERSWSEYRGEDSSKIKPDYIFVSGKMIVVSHHILDKTFKGIYPSDHLPLVVDLRLK